jgi:hypothetical protein
VATVEGEGHPSPWPLPQGERGGWWLVGGGPPFTRSLYLLTVFCFENENGERKPLSRKDLRFPDLFFLQVPTHVRPSSDAPLDTEPSI